MNTIDLAEALERANAENYLGDPEVVDYLLRDLGSRAIKRVNPDDPKQAWAHADIADCVRLANIFLGKDKNFAPMAKWNEPGVIDAFAKEALNLQGDSQQVMGGLFQEFLKDTYDLYSQAINGAEDDSWQFQIDAICHDYANVLLGVRDPFKTESVEE